MFQLPDIESCYATALWIKPLSTGRSILPYRGWPGNILTFTWIKAKAHSLTAFLDLLFSLQLLWIKLFHAVLNLHHSCNQGSAVFPYQVHYTESSCFITHHKLYVPLKLQFFPLLDCDLHLVSRYNLFFNCFNTPSIFYLHHLWLVELITKQIILLPHLPPKNHLLEAHWIFMKPFYVMYNLLTIAFIYSLNGPTKIFLCIFFLYSLIRITVTLN